MDPLHISEEDPVGALVIIDIVSATLCLQKCVVLLDLCCVCTLCYARPRTMISPVFYLHIYHAGAMLCPVLLLLYACTVCHARATISPVLCLHYVP